MAANRFDQLIAHWEPQLRQAFTDAIQNVRKGAQIELIARMLEKGDVDGALRAVGLDPAKFRILDKTFEAAYEAGGAATAQAIPSVRDEQGFRLKVQFNIRNPMAEQYLRSHSSDLIREVMDDQRQMIRDVLTDGMAKGLNPRTVALDLVGRVDARGVRSGGLIGLTKSQSEWVRAYSVELQTNPGLALKRKLRDKRFDRAIAKALNEQKPIPAELRQKMVTTYANRALRMRAEAIARTEAMSALHAAQTQAVDQAFGTGVIDVDQITYVWRTAHDKRVRDTHRSMDGQEVRHGESFVTGSGVFLRYPGDEMGPAEEIINCRCWREMKVDFLRGIV